MPLEFQPTVNSPNCLVRLNYLMTPITSSTYLLFKINGTAVTLLNISNGFVYRMSCWKQCPQYTFVNPLGSVTTCLSCLQYIVKCISCISLTRCTVCRLDAMLTSNYTCKTCTNTTSCAKCEVGDPIQGQCYNIQGCTAVQPMIVNGKTTYICTQCDDDTYVLDWQTNTCKCKTGRLVSGYCTEMTGCITLIPVATGLSCIFCNISAKFYYDSIT